MRHNLGRGAGAAVSGYLPGAIFSDAYNRSRPTAVLARVEQQSLSMTC